MPSKVAFFEKVFLDRRASASVLRGVELFNLRLVRDLCELGIEVALFVEPSWRDTVLRELPDAKGLRLVAANGFGSSLFSGLFAARRIRALAHREGRFDALLLGNVANRLIPALWLLRPGRDFARAVLVAHRKPSPRFLRAIRHLPGRIVAVSEPVAADFRGQGLAADVAVDYGIMDAGLFHPADTGGAPSPVPTDAGGAPSSVPADVGGAPSPVPADAGGAPSPVPADAGGAPSPVPADVGGAPSPVPANAGGAPSPVPANAGGAPSPVPADTGGAPSPVPANARGRLPLGKTRFCVLGALDNAWKGADTAVDAFLLLPESLRSRCELHLVAYRSPPSFPDQAGIVAHSWRDSSDIPAFLRSMDVLLVPSRDEHVMRETFSQAVVQGMLTGLPVVYAPIPVLSEKFDLGGGIPASTPAEFAAAMARLANNPALRAEMGAKGRATALARYVWDTARFVERHLFPNTAP